MLVSIRHTVAKKAVIVPRALAARLMGTESATSDQSVLKARALVKQQQHSIRQNEYSTSDEHSPDYQPMFYPTGIFVSCAVEEEKKRELVRLQHNIREKESNRQASWEAVRLEEKDLKKKTTEKEADIRRHAWE